MLTPTEIVTREDIDRWQSEDLADVMCRLPDVGIVQDGGIGQSSNIYVRGAEARHTLALIDSISLAKSGVTDIVDFSQTPLFLIQYIEMIRDPCLAIYSAGTIGGVVSVITQNTQPGGRV